MYILISNFFEFASLVTALLYLKSIKQQGWLLLAPYLLYTCVVEGLAAYYKYMLHEKNVWLYNPYIIISFAFYGWLIVNTMYASRLKQILLIVVAFFTIGALLWYFIKGSPTIFVSEILTVGSFFIIGIVLIFFYDRLQSIQDERVITNDPAFWIATGLLLFYTGISFSNAMYTYLSAAKIKIFNISIHNLIPQFLSVILYSCIIIAIVKCRRQEQIL